MADVLDFLHVDLFQSPEQLFREGAGLARSVALMAELGHPQDGLPVVHVAGTAGKGTVAAGVSAVLVDQGLTVGLHVSPHVYDLRERFSVSGRCCSADELVELLIAVLPAAASVAAGPHGAPTFFEVTLAMALVHFRRRHCDVAVVETGLGGRFDSTNTVTRTDKLAVITRIGLDHEAVLGHTLGAIAAQKAGILPAGGQAVVLCHGVAEIDDTLGEAGAAVGCRLHLVTPPPVTAGQVAHLVEDRALVAEAVAVLDRMADPAPPQEEAEPATPPEEVARVERVLGGLRLPGRFEVVRTSAGTQVVLDGAHNPMKLAALVDRLRHDRPGPPDQHWRWVFGCRRDKKAGAMLSQLARTVDAGSPQRTVALVQFPIESGDVPAAVSTDPVELEASAWAAGLDGAFAATLAEAVAFVDAAPDEPVVVAGSFGLLAALRPRLGATAREPLWGAIG